MKNLKVLISGGGTGGHIFPALSIADALRRRCPGVEILFVGAENRMEMQRVPAAGYDIVGLPVAGFDRHNLFKNISVLFKLLKSMWKARRIVRTFKPDVAVGVGGYASGPTLKAAQRAGVPTIIQEQNSYAGVTNKLLAAKARTICVAYPQMERFFPAECIVTTGNPVRKALLEPCITVEQAKESLGFKADKPLVLIVGGSLGARTLNNAMIDAIQNGCAAKAPFQILWQCGKRDYQRCAAVELPDNVHLNEFVADMAVAYRAADLVVSRAGAGTISELELLAKPCILVPSPNVAEDHQRKNAEALASRGAADMILDADAPEKLWPDILAIMENQETRNLLSENIAKLAMPMSDEKIVDAILTVALNPKPYMYSRIYFVGIGGIGMAALARYYLSKGMPVAGYDRTESALTQELVAEGAVVSYSDSMDAVPADFRQAEGTLVVYTPAIPADNIPLSFFRNNGFEVRKRAYVLGQITRHSKGLCFAGTHGKTTTSSMAAHILHCSPVGCNAFLGGILKGYDSNLMLSPTSPFSVIEADEYDRSFHQLNPYIAIINATDPDHLDIYGTEEAYLESFAHFTELIVPGGFLLMRTGLKLVPRPGKDVKVYNFGRSDGDFHAANVRTGNGTIIFDFVHPQGTITDIELGVPVDVNVDNAVASLAAVWLTDSLTDDLAREAMKSYPGVERRFEFHLKETMPGGHVVIDDYAHHPDEVSRSIESVRALYPNQKLTVAFQPHLYSRTRDFAPQFARALSMADEVFLIDIYPAREEPIPGVTSKIIFDDVKIENKFMISKEDFVDTLKNRNFEVLLTLGAGDLNLKVPQLVKSIKL